MKCFFFSSVGIKSNRKIDLDRKIDCEDEFLLLTFAACCVTMVQRNATDCHVFMRIVSDWFGCIFVISFNVSKKFRDIGRIVSSCLTSVYFLHKVRPISRT